jgi:hypothetical protein
MPAMPVHPPDASPPGDTVRAAPEGGAERVTVDLAALSAEERDGVDLLLDAELVAHELRGDELLVPAAERQRVAEMVAIAVSAPTRADDEDDDQGDPLPGDGFGPLATPARRAAGGLAELATATLAAAALSRRLGRRRAVLATAAAWSLLGHLAAVAVTGRAPGHVLAGTRVQSPPRPGALGGRTALRRWLVADGPLVIAGACCAGGRLSRSVAAVTAAGSLTVAAVVRASVLTDRWHRGLHDRTAGTVVTRAGRVGSGRLRRPRRR